MVLAYVFVLLTAGVFGLNRRFRFPRGGAQRIGKKEDSRNLPPPLPSKDSHPSTLLWGYKIWYWCKTPVLIYRGAEYGEAALDIRRTAE